MIAMMPRISLGRGPQCADVGVEPSGHKLLSLTGNHHREGKHDVKGLCQIVNRQRHRRVVLQFAHSLLEEHDLLLNRSILALMCGISVKPSRRSPCADAPGPDAWSYNAAGCPACKALPLAVRRKLVEGTVQQRKPAMMYHGPTRTTRTADARQAGRPNVLTYVFHSAFRTPHSALPYSSHALSHVSSSAALRRTTGPRSAGTGCRRPCRKAGRSPDNVSRILRGGSRSGSRYRRAAWSCGRIRLTIRSASRDISSRPSRNTVSFLMSKAPHQQPGGHTGPPLRSRRPGGHTGPPLRASSVHALRLGGRRGTLNRLEIRGDGRLKTPAHARLGLA